MDKKSFIYIYLNCSCIIQITLYWEALIVQHHHTNHILGVLEQSLLVPIYTTSIVHVNLYPLDNLGHVLTYLDDICLRNHGGRSHGHAPGPAGAGAGIRSHHSGTAG